MKRFLELIILILSGMMVILASTLVPPAMSVKSASPDPVPTENQYEYGIIVDSLLVIKGRIRRNQFLGDILLDYNVDYKVIDALSRKSKTVFDVRKIRAGNNYTIISTRDSLPGVLYFIYDISPSDYVVFDIRNPDSIHVYAGFKEIDTVLVTESGVISTSLWNSMIDQGADPNLANELSEIFAWTIDFFGLQKGDAYKVLYEKLYVEERYIGMGKVHAAVINHGGEDHYAYFFVQGSRADYFDDDGGSMRRTFLKAPLRYRRISSGYSHSRYHPILKIRRPHRGVDYAASAGTPVHAVGDGEIIFAGWNGQGGRCVKIRHNGTYTTAYLHLSGYGKGIKKGVRVTQGQVIGYVGMSGLATGPHLDFRFYRNGHPIDPRRVESPPAEPVDTTYWDSYIILRDSLKKALDTINIMEKKKPSA